MTARRVLATLAPMPFVALGVATIVFLGLRAVPGSPVDVLGSQGSITAQERAQIKQQLGLGQPLYIQYEKFISSLVQLKFGTSYYSGTSVGSQIGDALPATIELAIASATVMLIIGVGGGVIAARKKGTWIDAALRGTATTLFSVPWFSLGIVLILIFSVKLGWLPTIGRLPPNVNYTPVTHFILIDAIIEGQPGLIWPWIEHLILPDVTVGLTTAGFVLRVTRASLLEVGERDYITTAHAKGMTQRRVLTHHMARNASIPVVTIVGLLIGSLLGGVVVTEVVFAYPGIGQLLVQAILQRDYPVAEGAAVVIALTYVLINTLTDVSYVLLDPKSKTLERDG